MKKLRSLLLCFPVALAAGGFTTSVRAASVGSGGYTNDFSTQPLAADWSTVAITGGATDATAAGQIDAEVQAVGASAITAQTIAAAASPPDFNGSAAWSSTAFYLQTRPTGVRLTLLMCTLVNNLGVAASGVSLSYNFASALPVTEEVDGVRGYYSLSGAAGSWTVIPAFATATPGRLTANLTLTWPNGTPLYVVWADDNGSGSPDTAFQIDNFSAIAMPATQTPAMITSQPQSQTVAELAPASFTVGVSGNPAPTYQWYKNDAAIGGANGATYAIAAAPLSDSGAQFKVVIANTASNVNYSVTSSVVTLTVNADTVAPTLVRAIGVPPTTVSVDFSEGLRADTANIAANYAVTSAAGSLTISGAALQAGGSNVLLTTSAQTLNTAYTLIVNGVRDLSAASNRIAPNSTVAFTSVALTPADVGNPSVAGQVVPAGSGANITAGGTNISGTSDQFSFAYQQVSGNFDYKVRVASLSVADAWSKASLMARETLAANSTFASAVATPGPSGTFFQSRATTAAAAVNSGSGPVNYPNTWLRVTRNGNTFTGYSGVDGGSWFQLGAATIAMANTIYLGMAVSAAVPNGSAVPTATAQFREFMANASTALATAAPETEPPGPSSRRTPIVITEIMYNPFPDANSNVLEFIEIYNSNPHYEDIGGWRISGDIDYTFPANTQLRAGEYRVIARNPAHVMAAYGLSGVWGAYSNALKEAGTVRLRNKEDAILLEVNYDNSPPWPAAADGAGHSLVLARPSYGEGYVQAWGQSDKAGGSPGGYDGAGATPQRNVVINEFLANSDGTNVDYIELYNHSNQEVDLSGCTLSDDPHTNKFVLPPNTRIAARSFLAFDQGALGFGLSSGGETIYFRNADGARVLDAVRFDAQAANVSAGRYPNGAKEIYALTALTPGAANAAILVHDIVINEIMYNPVSAVNDDEFVELHNKGTNAVSLGGWRFVAGIDYKFPSNAVLAAGGYLVVAKNAARLMTNNPGLQASSTYGNYQGSLRNRGDRVALGRPDVSYTTNGMGVVQTNTVQVVVDEVTYGVGGQWGNWSKEGGSSLELMDPRANHRLTYNWGDSDDTGDATNGWTTIQATGMMDNGSGTANFFEILALGEGEYLVDDVEVLPASGVNAVSAANSNFEGGQGGWLFRGTHIQSFIENSGGYGNNGRCLHVKATARGDSIHNRCLVPITTPSGTITLRAKVRWLRGWPEILFRVHGNYMEATGPLLAPTTLGTPGARNSRWMSNAPPALDLVGHFPVVPAANQAVIVSARVQDPHGVASVTLRYRLDPATTYTSVAMNDAGVNGDAVAGDGLYGGTILGQASGALVAYYVEAADGAAPAATVSFPRGASPTTPECVVRFGDPVITSGFGTYRQWMTANYYNIWNNRPALSNERLPLTLVYGNFRAIHFAAVKWAGSPYHQFGGAPNTTGHYSFDIPGDDLFLGTDNLNKVHAPGNGPFDDANIQREQTCYWFARQLCLPWNYRRCINMYFNGNRPGGPNQLMEDTETPGNDVVESRFPDDPDGNLFKLQPWFEVDDGTTRSLGFANNSWADLTRYTTPSNGVPIQKLARYRHNYLARAVKGSANDYNDVFALKDAADTAAGPAHVANMQALCDMEQWMRIFAVHHSVGDWDHFGSQNSQNMYGYKPAQGKWQLMIWDMNIVIGNSGSWGQGANLFVTSGGGANMAKLYDTAPPFRRMYFRALKELCNGAFLPANLNPVLDSKYSAYLASGVSPTSPQNIKDWIAGARSSILTTVAAEDAALLRVLSINAVATNSLTTSSNLITLTGEAPVEARTITINGVEYPTTWSNVKTWTLRLAVSAATNTLVVRAYDVRGNLLPAMTATLTVIYTGPIASPENALVFNEIMYNNAGNSNASFVEIFNTANLAFDLSGWRVNGLDYTFPEGSIIAGRQYLVLAKNIGVFTATYGAAVAPFGQFNGNLDLDGETLTLIKPATTNAPEVAIDKVRYEARPPWSTLPNGGGASLQLFDTGVDNSRVSDWSDGVGWRLYSTNINLGSSVGSRLFAFLDAPGGEVYIDDISLVALAGPTAGSNYIQNGGFETELSGPWSLGTNFAPTVISTAVSRSGSASLRLIATAAPAAINTLNTFSQEVGAATNLPYTLSYYYLPTPNANKLTIRFNSTARPENIVRPGVLYTPGAANQTVTTLPPYDPVWLNEVQPNNATGPMDGAMERDPWVELYNSGPSAVSLAGYYLADNYATNLRQWQFPADATINPGEFKLVWLDAQTNQGTASEWHASFQPGVAAGQVALVRLVSNLPQITDYLTYSNLGPSLSYGDFPEGQPFNRQVFYQTSAGTTNISRAINVFINEWMAGNTNVIADPAGAAGSPEYDDWFELYNPTAESIDLGGFYLTDNLGDRTQFRVPTNGQYVIPAGGFLLVWADNQPEQNTAGQPDLHVNFQLNRDGEAIGLYFADGETPVDTVTFGAQTNNVSEGRFADGAGARSFMPCPTPGGPNSIGPANRPPVLAAIPNQTATLGQTLSLAVTATDPDVPAQALTFSLVAGPSGASLTAVGQFTWTPNAAQTPSTNTVTVRVTDSGCYPRLSDTRSFNVVVGSVEPTLQISAADGNATITKSGDTTGYDLADASDVTGPYLTLPGATFPYVVSPTANRKFYRLIKTIATTIEYKNPALSGEPAIVFRVSLLAGDTVEVVRCPAGGGAATTLFTYTPDRAGDLYGSVQNPTVASGDTIKLNVNGVTVASTLIP